MFIRTNGEWLTCSECGEKVNTRFADLHPAHCRARMAPKNENPEEIARSYT